MTTERCCRQCGGPIPADAPQGSCPSCLLRAGLERTPTEAESGAIGGALQCPECGVVLYLPEGVGGRRLKCPRCAHRFRAPSGPATAPPKAEGRAASSTIVARAVPSDPELPEVRATLREAFDLPLWTEGAPDPSAPEACGALALFEGDARPAPRRPSPAEARARARRCPTCGGHVPAGMSLCSSCGLDLETGIRAAPVDDLLPEEPRPAPTLPIDSAVVGGTCALGSLVLALASTRQWLLGFAGWQYFLPAGLFGLHASVQFLRGKSARLLLAALTLGALIDVVALITLPIVAANLESTIVRAGPAEGPDGEEMAIAPVVDRLDTGRVGLGVAILLLYPVVSVYLMSPRVRRHLVR